LDRATVLGDDVGSRDRLAFRGSGQAGDDRLGDWRGVRAVECDAADDLDLHHDGDPRLCAAVWPGRGVDEERVTQVDVAGSAGGELGPPRHDGGIERGDDGGATETSLAVQFQDTGHREM
jgi:hypothetical protein